MSHEEPLAVWDARRAPVRKITAWSEWAREHGIPVDDTYRIEFYLVDAPFARVFRYAVNADGRCFKDPATGEAAEEPPVDVILSELPAEASA